MLLVAEEGELVRPLQSEPHLGREGACRLRTTNGVNPNGAAAKVRKFARSGKKVRPGTFGKIKVGYREYPKSPSVKKYMTFAVTPRVLTPFVSLSEPGLSLTGVMGKGLKRFQEATSE